jgi:hypothetical protein
MSEDCQTESYKFHVNVTLFHVTHDTKKKPQPRLKNFRRFIVKISQRFIINIVTTEVRAVSLIQLAAGYQKGQNGIVFRVMKFVTQSIDICQPV